jgi:hypothetical protein
MEKDGDSEEDNDEEVVKQVEKRIESLPPYPFSLHVHACLSYYYHHC